MWLVPLTGEAQQSWRRWIDEKNASTILDKHSALENILGPVSTYTHFVLTLQLYVDFFQT